MTNDLHIRLCAVEKCLGLRTNTCNVSKSQNNSKSYQSSKPKTFTKGRFMVKNGHPSSKPKTFTKGRFMVKNGHPSSKPKTFTKGRFMVKNGYPSSSSPKNVSAKRDVEGNMRKRKNELIQSMPQHRYSHYHLTTRNAMPKPRYNSMFTGSS